jgi:hydrogenase expression/formation protein HypE
LFVRGTNVERALATLKSDPEGVQARVIGSVEEPPDGLCELVTTMGGRRIVQKPHGEQLPQIC